MTPESWSEMHQQRKQTKSVKQRVRNQQPTTSRRTERQRRRRKNQFSLQEALRSIDKAELEDVLAKDEVSFPDSSDIWLKDLASLLNLRLDTGSHSDNDIVFRNQPYNYPSSELSAGVKTLLLKTMDRCQSSVLVHFLQHCINSMTSDMDNGMSTYGYRICIQLLLFNHPDVAIKVLNNYTQKLTSDLHRPNRVLPVMWSLGQAGARDLTTGLKVWLSLMMPVLSIRSLADYAVLYLELLFRLHPDSKLTYGAVPMKQYFQLLDELYSSKSSLSLELRQKVLHLLPKLKAATFGDQPQRTMHKFFSSFLSRCNGNCPHNLKEELLSSLVDCLQRDQQTFSTWRLLYVKNLSQSSLLLNHLLEAFDELYVDEKMLHDTVTSFLVTNEELSSTTDTHDSTATCQELLSKLNTQQSRFYLWTFLLIVFIIGIVVAVDAYVNGGPYKSITYNFLLDYGVISFAKESWIRLQVYTGQAEKWLRHNVPYYYELFQEIVEPYLKAGWFHLRQAGSYLYVVSKPIRDWTATNAPIAFDWMNKQFSWLWVSLQPVGTVIGQQSMFIYNYTCNATRHLSDWLATHVLKN